MAERMKWKIDHDGGRFDLSASQRGDVVCVEWDDVVVELRVVSAADGRIIVERDGKLLTIVGARTGDDRQVWVNGRAINYQIVTDEAESEQAEMGALSASIPAVVSEILVAVDDVVAAGDKLILLESMKMIIGIQAPYGGRVMAVNCEVGESVQPGEVLIVIEDINHRGAEGAEEEKT